MVEHLIFASICWLVVRLLDTWFHIPPWSQQHSRSPVKWHYSPWMRPDPDLWAAPIAARGLSSE